MTGPEHEVVVDNAFSSTPFLSFEQTPDEVYLLPDSELVVVEVVTQVEETGAGAPVRKCTSCTGGLVPSIRVPTAVHARLKVVDVCVRSRKRHQRCLTLHGWGSPISVSLVEDLRSRITGAWRIAHNFRWQEFTRDLCVWSPLE